MVCTQVYNLDASMPMIYNLNGLGVYPTMPAMLALCQETKLGTKKNTHKKASIRYR